MITYDNIINEGYSGLTKRDVGRGYGGILGGLIGGGLATNFLTLPAFKKMIDTHEPEDTGDFLRNAGLAAAIAAGSKYIGGKMGEKMYERPDEKIDEKSKLDRIGALASLHAKGLPSAISALPGMSTASRLGTDAYSSYADNGIANKLGYGNFGKFGNLLLGPVVGLTTPEKLRDKRK